MKRTLIKKSFMALLILGVTAFTLTSQETDDSAFDQTLNADETTVEDSTAAQAPAKEFTFNVIPVLGFDMLQLEKESFVLTPSGTLQFMRRKDASSTSRQPDVIAAGASYSQSIFTKKIEGYDERQFHSMSVFAQVAAGKNNFMMQLALSGAKPFDSYKNFNGVLMYGRQLIKTDSITFTAGGGIIAADLGLKIGSFEPFVIPLPLLQFAYNSEYFNASFDWIGLPSVSLTLLPHKMFRFKGSCSLGGFDLPSDLKFDCAVCCYPLTKTKMGDFMSISAGITNSQKGFKIDNKNSLKYQYYSAYGELSLTLITLRAGYAFGGKQTLTAGDEKFKKDYDGGVFATIQAMYMF